MSPESGPPGFIPPHGNYRELLSYQKAEVAFDITFRFCQRFLSKGDRTIDQMIQPARSGSRTSPKPAGRPGPRRKAKSS